MKIGYARVSTDGQSVDAQVAELKAAGCDKVFKETASGAKTDRLQLRKAIASLCAGDILLVTRLGRGFALTPEQRRQALARLDAGEASRRAPDRLALTGGFRDET